MACRGCGEDPKITKAQAELLVERALKALNFADEAKIKEIINAMKEKGELSDGLQDCDGTAIVKTDKLVLCSKLADLIKALAKKGELPFVTDLVVNGTTMTWKDGGVAKTYDLRGAKGDKGDTGAVGPQGPQGPKGDNANIIAGDGIKKDGDKISLKIDPNTLEFKEGKLTVKHDNCVSPSSLNPAQGNELGLYGQTCFYRSIDTKTGNIPLGLPVNPIADTATQPAITDVSQLAQEFKDYDKSKSYLVDISGWQIAGFTEVTQYLSMGGHFWARTNHQGMHPTGQLANENAWSDWKRLDALPAMPTATARDIKLVNSSGKTVVGYIYSTEQ